jgi:hypothetical protein
MVANREVRNERTGWRDEAISERHRLYGYDAPFVDLDFVGIEYDKARVMALVEYKAKGARIPSLEHPSYRAMRELADNSKVPFLVVFYDPQTWMYFVMPANQFAQRHFKTPVMLTERSYVEFLYRLRNRQAPAGLLEKLNHFLSDRAQQWLKKKS